MKFCRLEKIPKRGSVLEMLLKRLRIKSSEPLNHLHLFRFRPILALHLIEVMDVDISHWHLKNLVHGTH